MSISEIFYDPPRWTVALLVLAGAAWVLRDLLARFAIAKKDNLSLIGVLELLLTAANLVVLVHLVVANTFNEHETKWLDHPLMFLVVMAICTFGSIALYRVFPDE